MWMTEALVFSIFSHFSILSILEDVSVKYKCSFNARLWKDFLNAVQFLIVRKIQYVMNVC